MSSVDGDLALQVAMTVNSTKREDVQWLCEQYEEGGCAMTVWTIAVTVRENYEEHWGAMAVNELSEERGGAVTACE